MYVGQGNIDGAFTKLNSFAPADMQKGSPGIEPEVLFAELFSRVECCFCASN